MPTPLGIVASHRTAVAPSIPMTGLALWLDANDATTFSYSSGVTVSQWRDKSGGIHHFAQGTVGSQPTRDATINGVTAVRFNDKGLGCGAFASTFTAAELFVVVQNLVENGTGIFGAFGSSGAAQHYPFVDGTVYEPWGSTVRQTLGNPVPNLTDPHIYNLRTAAGSFIAEINGAAFFSTATNTVGFATGNYVIGNGGTGGNDCKIGEFIMYDRVLNTTERGQVRTYLTTKWGTP